MTDFSHHTPKALTEADLAGLPRAVSTHTPGRISVRLPFSTASRYPAYIESGDRILAAINGGVTYEDLLQAHANARRLVACWNALEGVPTNDIESVLIHGKALKDVVSERDALAGRVTELETEVDEQCRLNGMGAERELALMGRVRELEAERDAAPLRSQEQRAVLADPGMLVRLIGYHDAQEAAGEAMEEGWGKYHERRALELLAIGRKVIAEDPGIWEPEIIAEFKPRYSERAALSTTPESKP